MRWLARYVAFSCLPKDVRFMSSMQTRLPTGTLLVCPIMGGSISCVASLAGSVIWMYGQWLLLSIISLPSPLGISLDVMNLYRKRSSQRCRPLESLTPRPQTERNRPLHTLDPTMPQGTLGAAAGPRYAGAGYPSLFHNLSKGHPPWSTLMDKVSTREGGFLYKGKP